jgi:hypothetical protein
MVSEPLFSIYAEFASEEDWEEVEDVQETE